MRCVIGISGASGAIYAYRLLQMLNVDKDVIISENAKSIMKDEIGIDLVDIKNLCRRVYNNYDWDADIASGRERFDAMVIVPCSTSTLSKIACGISDNLISRVASVALKERRKLILVIRETPLSKIHLENMAKLSSDSCIILPPCPGFYTHPKTIDDIVDFVVKRILMHLNVTHRI